MHTTTDPVPQDFSDQLELYLDGLLGEGPRAEFERLCASNPAMARELELARRIAGSVSRQFTPPSPMNMAVFGTAAAGAARTPASAHDTADPPAPIPFPGPARPRAGSTPRWRWAGYAVAAVLGIAAVAWWSSTVPDPAAVRRLTAMEVMASAKQSGFVPIFVCKDDEEFASTVKKRFGTPLLVAAESGLAVLGWAYSDTYAGELVTKNSLVLMARVDGQDVLVFMDRDPALTGEGNTLELGPAPAGHRLFKRTLGPLILYELTPFDHPRVLDACYIPAPR